MDTQNQIDIVQGVKSISASFTDVQTWTLEEQIMMLQRQLQQERQINEQLTKTVQSQKQVGSIYGYKQNSTGQVIYVGSHKSAEYEDRCVSHKSDCQKGISVPFYKYCMALGLSQFTPFLIKTFEYTTTAQLEEEEYRIQQEYNSIQVSNSFYCQFCQTYSKCINKFIQHQVSCQQGIKSTIDDQLDIVQKPKARKRKQ